MLKRGAPAKASSQSVNSCRLSLICDCNFYALVLMPQRVSPRAASAFLHLLYAVTPCANLMCIALLSS